MYLQIYPGQWTPQITAVKSSKITDIQTLENIQRSFTSKIDGCQQLDYYQRLTKLKLMSLQRRRERYILIHMFKILQNISPNDLNIKFVFSDRRGIQAVIPPLHRRASSRAQRTYDDSFGMLGPRLWNILPKSTTLQPTLGSFKSSLQKMLDATPDQPPTRGYTPTNHNSLLEWRLQTSGGLQTADRWPTWSRREALSVSVSECKKKYQLFTFSKSEKSKKWENNILW